MKRSVGFSILIHLLIAAGLLLQARFPSRLRQDHSEFARNAHRIEISGRIRGGAKEKAEAEGRENDSGATREARTAKAPRLRGLGIGFRWPEPGAPAGEGAGHDVGEGDDAFDIAGTMSMEEESTLVPFFRALWKRIDATVGYPRDFVDQRITGDVTIQIEVDHRGAFTGKVADLSGDDSFLKAYVAASVVHALKEPLPDSAWIRDRGFSVRDRILIAASFEYRLFSHGEAPPSDRVSHLKNVFRFRRHAFAGPLLNEILGRYMPPIIPIGPGIYIDFIAAYQWVKNYRERHKPGEAQLRASRLDAARGTWERMIRESPRESAKAGN